MVVIARNFLTVLAVGVMLGVSPAQADEVKSAAVASVPADSATAGSTDDIVYVPKHHETNYAAWQIKSGECTIKCIDPHAACSDSEQVLETMKEFCQAYSAADYNTLSSLMDEGCTTFDEGTKELIIGKKAVLEHLKANMVKYHSADDPLILYTIEHPYAKVTGDVAVVSFVAHKTFGGKNPQKLESRCTDVYMKEDGKWRRMHYRSNWKQV